MIDEIREKQRQLDGLERLATLFGRGCVIALVVIAGSTLLKLAAPLPPALMASVAVLGGGFWAVARWGASSFERTHYSPAMAELRASFVAQAEQEQLQPAFTLPAPRGVLAEALLHGLRADPESDAAPALVHLVRHRPELTASWSLEPPEGLDAATLQAIDRAADGTDPDRLAALLPQAEEATQQLIQQHLKTRLAEADAQTEAQALRQLLTLPRWQWRGALDRFFAAEQAQQT